MQTTTTTPIADALKEHFGYDSFLPLQEEIISDALAGRDVFALLPTGGGKSLCYQLPALLRDGVTVVVSPLIALMKDQVDQLRASGIEATFINSSLDLAEQQSRGREVLAGQHRLLYVAPERIMTTAFLDFLRRLEVNLIAIDEAHCISEWGHDFRPEYRQLSRLRPLFPDTPVMAMTATATERVRADILEQLGLCDPAVHIGSFNRRNLTYHVRAKASAYEQLLGFVRQRPGESGIVYCHTRKSTETLADRLCQDGVKARPYNAGLDPATRTRNQDAFSRDEVAVICATTAFGMGVNKSNVRFVVHYDMPKSMEGYHQETGRAGRDGLPAECILLYGAGDPVRYARLIDEKEDPHFRDIMREQLNSIVSYSESSECRRRGLLAYFGEAYEEPNCNGCDNCIQPRPTFDATESVRKFLAAVFRIKEKSGFNVGITHVGMVLAGSKSEKVQKLGHHEMPAFGKGKEHTQVQWSEIGRQLVSMGLLYQNPKRMNTVELTAEGIAALKERRSIQLAELKHEDAVSRKAALACDEQLFECLRELRLTIANERSLLPYMVFSDLALRQMARDYPSTEDDFRRISGVGESKLRDFGAQFLGVINDYLKTNAKQTFTDTPTVRPRPAKASDSARETLRLFRLGRPVEDIAQQREFAVSTIYGHLSIMADSGEAVDLDTVLSADQQKQIAGAFAKLGWANISGVQDLLENAYPYGLLKLYRSVRAPREPAAESASPSATPAHIPEYPSRNPGLAHAPA
jgi:ATP-dependent DNA helicase RecQ